MFGWIDGGNNSRDDEEMAATRTTEYAVRALVVLQLGSSENRVWQAAELARISGTPPKFLEQVLRLLRKGGLVRSRRGSGGGYELARPAEKIMMDEIIRLFDGGAEPISKSGDPFRVEWSRLKAESENAAMGVMKKESLAKLADRIRSSRWATSRITEYQI